MTAIASTLLCLAAASHLGAAGASIVYLRGLSGQLLPIVHRLLVGAALLLAGYLGVRWLATGSPPLTGPSESLAFFVTVATVIVLAVTRPEPMRAVVGFYLPPLAVIALLSCISFMTRSADARAATLEKLQDAPLLMHVGLVYIAYALFFVASLTSVAYVFQAQHLKRRRNSPLFQKLPSLERLDRTLFRLIGAGYPLFLVTLALGLFWALRTPDLLAERWWLSPKILLAVVMAAFYALTFHGRRMGLLRGQKLAYVVFIGFSLLLGVSIVLGLLHLTSYNFWESPE